jgi:hypothetical protein
MTLTPHYSGPRPRAPWRCEQCGPVWRIYGDARHDCDRCAWCGSEIETNQDPATFRATRRRTIHRLAIAA